METCLGYLGLDDFKVREAAGLGTTSLSPAWCPNFFIHAFGNSASQCHLYLDQSLASLFSEFLDPCQSPTNFHQGLLQAPVSLDTSCYRTERADKFSQRRLQDSSPNFTPSP